MEEISENISKKSFSVWNTSEERAAYYTGQVEAYKDILIFLNPEAKKSLNSHLIAKAELRDMCRLHIRQLQERIERAKKIFRKLVRENEKLRQWELFPPYKKELSYKKEL